MPQWTACWRVAGMFALLAVFGVLDSNEACGQDTKPATLKVHGYGPIGNLELRRLLIVLETGGQRPLYFNAIFLEDAAAILRARLSQDGFPRPTITAIATLTTGQTIKFVWKDGSGEVVPRTFMARDIQLYIEKGIFYYYGQVRFQGLKTVALEKARSYFVPTGLLLPLQRFRVYSPQRRRRGLSSLTDTLQQQGYRQAKVDPQVSQNEETGEVTLLVRVEQGLLSKVRSIRTEVLREPLLQPVRSQTNYPNKPYTTQWEQNYVQNLRTNYYHQGYPDVTVRISQIATQQVGNVIELDMQAQIQPGPQITIHKVKFEGEKKTKESVMKDRVKLHSNELLDPTRIEKARFRLSRLGIFKSVGLRYDKVDNHTRDVVFPVQEGKELETYLLATFGTYELLRVGFEVDQNNIWGLAHNSELRISQSFKTSLGNYVYNIPEVLWEDTSVFFNASALRREEISFVRQEYGGGIGLDKYFRQLSLDVRPRYNYQLLDASEMVVNPEDGLSRAQVGAFIFDARFDRRDNPLYPHHGVKLLGTLELASEYLGGEVGYQRFELSSSYHFPIGPGQWLHLALDHGFVVTDRGPQEDLPFNKRFFPGGENSIRGYTQGEAAPLDARGDVVGAETYVLGSVELEQSLTPQFSLVLFVDSVGISRRISDYPLHDVLVSVGGGLSWRTVVGPVRLEYGYNLNQRPHDPIGTVQFSVGFPF